MTELTVGDSVYLTAPEALTSDGGMVFEGEKGAVVGLRGFEEVIVSWGSTPPYRVGSVRSADLRRHVTPGGTRPR